MGCFKLENAFKSTIPFYFLCWNSTYHLKKYQVITPLFISLHNIYNLAWQLFPKLIRHIGVNRKIKFS
jgi:hypothetical protein